jgi:N6-adenosine-specific RNA methylase IME4
MITSWPFTVEAGGVELRPLSFDFVMADFPWKFINWSGGQNLNSKSVEHQYDTMLLDKIAALPIGQLLRGDGVLWMWCTAPMLPQQIALLPRWGLRYATMGGWMKRTPKNKSRWGTGYRLRSTMEPYVIALAGDLETPRTIPNGFDGLAREHSRKPEEAYAWAEKMVPNGERLDLFSRTDRPGWTCWGNEAGKFGAAA